MKFSANAESEINFAHNIYEANISLAVRRISLKKPRSMNEVFMAGEYGFEPQQTESESVVLPLHYSPTAKEIIYQQVPIVKSF